MSHTYPLASSAQDAFDPDAAAARTRRGAENKADGVDVLSLETEWLTLETDEAEDLLDKAEAANGTGFVQRYADASGSTVLAVTYWKITETSRKTQAKPDKSPEAVAKSDDHTDDLYFRSRREKRKRRKRQPKIDPRQLELFSAPDQMGYEHRAPENPGVMITDEEGDGTTFGVAPKPQKPKAKPKPRREPKPKQQA